jgi:hypothetical protein
MIRMPVPHLTAHFLFCGVAGGAATGGKWRQRINAAKQEMEALPAAQAYKEL